MKGLKKAMVRLRSHWLGRDRRVYARRGGRDGGCCDGIRFAERDQGMVTDLPFLSSPYLGNHHSLVVQPISLSQYRLTTRYSSSPEPNPVRTRPNPKTRRTREIGPPRLPLLLPRTLSDRLPQPRRGLVRLLSTLPTTATMRVRPHQVERGRTWG